MSQGKKTSVPETLAEMNTKIDYLVTRADEDRVEAKALSIRVSALEQFKYQLMGAAIVASFIFSIVADFIKKAL